MNEQYIGVTEHLLRKNEYVKNYQLLLRRHLLFEEFLEYLLQVYSSYKAFTSILYDPTSVDDQRASLFRSFKTGLLLIVRQFSEITTFHETEIAKQKHRRNEELSASFDRLIGELQNFEPQQKTYKANLKRIAEKVERIRKEAALTKQAQNELINYFSEGYTYNRYSQLSQEFAEANQMSTAARQTSEGLTNLRMNFLNEVSNFRRALANSRYSILDRFKGLCSEAKTGLATLFVILYENTRRSKAQFLKEKESNDNEWLALRSSRARDRTKMDNPNSTEGFLTNVNKITSDYNRKLTDLIRFVTVFVQGIIEAHSKFRVVAEKHKRGLMQSVGSNFELAQSPLPWVKSVFEMFENCTNRFAEMAGKLKDSQNELMALSQKLKRHIEISISLLQATSPQVQSTALSNIRQQREEMVASNIKGQIAYHATELEKNINSQELQSICRRMFDTIEERFGGIVKYLQAANPLRRRQVENSMDISRVTEYDQIVFQREATRDEGWLYVEWRDNSYNTAGNLEQARMALEQIKTPPPPPDNSNDVETYPCTLSNREVKGKLTVTDKSIKFVSQHGNLSLKVPYSEINNVSSKFKFLIGNFLYVETRKGELVFDIISGGADKCKQKINSQRDTGGGGEVTAEGGAAVPQEPKRKKVVLEASEIAFIEVRKAKIQAELVDKKKLTTINQTETFKDINIQDFYDAIYSDSPKVIKGKRWDCPMVYLIQALGNYKVKANPYKNPGPKFYTGVESVTFQNCPLYSEREIEYDHDLPKMGIPFMPKFVHVKNNDKVYWVSHEEFQVNMESRTSGAPYTSSFYVQILHIVKKKGTDVEVQYRGGLEFVQNPAFKSVLKDKGESQMKQGFVKNLNLYRQRVEAFKSSGGKEEEKVVADTAEGTLADGTEERPSSKSDDLARELESVKAQNKRIIIASVVVLLISILLKLF